MYAHTVLALLLSSSFIYSFYSLCCARLSFLFVIVYWTQHCFELSKRLHCKVLLRRALFFHWLDSFPLAKRDRIRVLCFIKNYILYFVDACVATPFVYFPQKKKANGVHFEKSSHIKIFIKRFEFCGQKWHFHSDDTTRFSLCVQQKPEKPDEMRINFDRFVPMSFSNCLFTLNKRRKCNFFDFKNSTQKWGVNPPCKQKVYFYILSTLMFCLFLVSVSVLQHHIFHYLRFLLHLFALWHSTSTHIYTRTE